MANKGETLQLLLPEDVNTVVVVEVEVEGRDLNKSIDLTLHTAVGFKGIVNAWPLLMRKIMAMLRK